MPDTWNNTIFSILFLVVCSAHVSSAGSGVGSIRIPTAVPRFSADHIVDQLDPFCVKNISTPYVNLTEICLPDLFQNNRTAVIYVKPLESTKAVISSTIRITMMHIRVCFIFKKYFVSISDCFAIVVHSGGLDMKIKVDASGEVLVEKVSAFLEWPVLIVTKGAIKNWIINQILNLTKHTNLKSTVEHQMEEFVQKEIAQLMK